MYACVQECVRTCAGVCTQENGKTDYACISRIILFPSTADYILRLLIGGVNLGKFSTP